jgi:hypothetical protein
VDRDRHHAEFRAGQQHDRFGNRPAVGRQRSEVFGVAGVVEAGGGEHVLGNRICHHGGRLAGAGQTHGFPDAGQHGFRRLTGGVSRCGVHRQGLGQHR